MATEKPEWNYLGLEIRRPTAALALERAAGLGTRNCHVVCCNANVRGAPSFLLLSFTNGESTGAGERGGGGLWLLKSGGAGCSLCCESQGILAPALRGGGGPALFRCNGDIKLCGRQGLHAVAGVVFSCPAASRVLFSLSRLFFQVYLYFVHVPSTHVTACVF